jgi:nitrite reductase/ring-hydroxylating ferredoxin subunit
MDPVLPGEMLCTLEEIVDGQAIAVDAELADGADSVIVLRQGERVDAYLNVCPHAGRRLDWAPGKFLVKAGTLVCAAHGASFAVGSGLCTNGPCRGESLRRVAVEVVNRQVRLSLSDTSG